MHAAVCVLRAGQPRSAGDAAKLGQFIGQFSWVTGDPIVVKGLYHDPNFVIRVTIYEIELRSKVLHIELHKNNDVVVGMQTRKFI